MRSYLSELDEEDSLWEGAGTVVTEPEDLEGRDPARRDEEVAAYSAVLSDEDEMPHLEESESEAESSSETSDHYREAMTTTSEVSTEDEEAQTVFLSTSRQKEAVMHKGEWRHVRGNLSKIREYMQEEIER